MPVRLSNFIFNVLSERKILLRIGGEVKGSRLVWKGLPQGSILSPLLYNLYTSDLELLISSCKILQYADDLLLCFSDISVLNGASVLSESLQALQLYLHSFGLELSASKSNLVVFSRKKKRCWMSLLYWGALGFPLQNLLSSLVYFLTSNYREPIIVTTQSQKLKKISASKDASLVHGGPTPLFFKLLYNAIVRSHLDYGSFLLESIKSISLKRLNLVKARALRIIVDYFKTTLPLIEKSIEAADFLVIDTEFTGLINGKDVSLFDSPSEYYMRLLNGSSDFLLIQFGLCAFYWNEKENHYMNDAYNFYLFPRVRPGPERMFLCQSSSLDFLASQGFDFNKLIREGISYMTEPTETRLRDSLTERQKQYSNDKEIITVPEENKQHIEDICKRVRNFLDEKKSDEMEIDRVNAFVRRLLFQELGIRFKNEAFVETKVLENKNRVLKISRIKSESDSKCRDDQKKEKEWEEFEDAIGFSKVARMISQSEKLVVGHNMLLDVIHTLNHFFQPLPADYATFKEFAHCMFPWLLDTKYMSSLPPFKDKINSSVLSHLLTTLSEPPFSMPKAESLAGRGYNCTDEKHHEAGYDAYMTGLCFLAMHAHVASMRGETIARVKAADSAILKPFTNKLYLARTAHQDSPYINLMGDDPSPSRDHVFFITFPQEWQRNDINQLFSAYGPIIIQFLDDNSALVALSRREQARDVLRAFAGSRRVSLIPFNKYKQVLGKDGGFDVKDEARCGRSLTTEVDATLEMSWIGILVLTTKLKSWG
ncbi:Poly(A)-specific ribonuclease PARN [Eumeta japonica]|uniref:Poly(A)-specific ribonuclease PARN n=1 Tax=Eumeta variegata TaxID=151549 RepID=A0A4C1V9J8_EUMVA|nr:Poly(A)-specific ribonuclease PARN [Eumeta japonica]